MTPSPRRPGAPLGNTNSLKHGFYSRRLKKRDVSDVEHTDLKGLAEEIALIRIFTRRVIEACDPSADLYELAGILRILCLASSTISHIIKTQYLLSLNHDDFSEELNEAIRQVHEEWEKDTSPPILAYPDIYYATHPRPSTGPAPAAGESLPSNPHPSGSDN